jgi:hypothetical protein
MNVHPEMSGGRCLLMPACIGILSPSLAAAETSDESVAAVAVSTAVPSFARPPSGSLIGVTMAPGGLSLAAVAVVIRSVSGGTARQLTSDADGNFSARDLPPGMYEIAASKEGFPRLAAPSKSRRTGLPVRMCSSLGGSLALYAVSPLPQMGFLSQASVLPFAALRAPLTATC